MQLDDLQINNNGKITMSTALALWTEKRWKRNRQFTTPVAVAEQWWWDPGAAWP